MFRILPVKEFARRKKMLVVQSDIHRNTFLLQAATLEHSLTHFKKRFAIFGLSSVALSAGASFAGLLFARRKSAAIGAGGGLLSKIFSGISAFNQIKSIFSRFKSATATASETEEV
ncbi:MAG: hypothetical protein JWQ04_600 [Pedosphaera sp.]|nr:hypothetical protein [Pedosphaera sp.]